MKTIAVINFKGGVGKTTFSVCISQALAITGFRVLTIDNDSQHNLSFLLGRKLYSPNIRDIYRSPLRTVRENFMYSIRETGLQNLHIITSQNELSYSDVKDPDILKKIIKYCGLDRFYDYIIIDNPPGLDSLQLAAVNAANGLFIPTDLSYYAINAVHELYQKIGNTYRNQLPNSKIIINSFRNTKSQRDYLAVLKELFPHKIARTFIPYDPVFDFCMKTGKTLFIHRLYTKAAAFYLKIIHELFNLDEDDTWEKVMTKRNDSLRLEARNRFFLQQESRKKTTSLEIQKRADSSVPDHEKRVIQDRESVSGPAINS